MSMKKSFQKLKVSVNQKYFNQYDGDTITILHIFQGEKVWVEVSHRKKLFDKTYFEVLPYDYIVNQCELIEEN